MSDYFIGKNEELVDKLVRTTFGNMVINRSVYSFHFAVSNPSCCFQRYILCKYNRHFILFLNQMLAELLSKLQHPSPPPPLNALN